MPDDYEHARTTLLPWHSNSCRRFDRLYRVMAGNASSKTMKINGSLQSKGCEWSAAFRHLNAFPGLSGKNESEGHRASSEKAGTVNQAIIAMANPEIHGQTTRSHQDI
jgi:hypothetical protein